jgi:hypothetical protein
MHITRRRWETQISMGKLKGKKPLWKPNITYENITAYIREIRCEGQDWTQLAEYRFQGRNLVITIINLRVS